MAERFTNSTNNPASQHIATTIHPVTYCLSSLLMHSAFGILQGRVCSSVIQPLNAFLIACVSPLLQSTSYLQHNHYDNTSANEPHCQSASESLFPQPYLELLSGAISTPINFVVDSRPSIAGEDFKKMYGVVVRQLTTGKKIVLSVVLGGMP